MSLSYRFLRVVLFVVGGAVVFVVSSVDERGVGPYRRFKKIQRDQCRNKRVLRRRRRRRRTGEFEQTTNVFGKEWRCRCVFIVVVATSREHNRFTMGRNCY